MSLKRNKLILFILIVFLFINILNVYATELQVDIYGGYINIGVTGTPTGSFHLEKIGNRWWMISPLGNPLFLRSVSMVDSRDWGGSGGFLSYDAVYIKKASGEFSQNLKKPAESTAVRDVVHNLTNVTLSQIGDEIYLGWRMQPAFTYFWLDQLGVGGKIEWYYSTGSDWKLINSDGNPFTAEVLNSDNSYNMDIGNYMAPDKDGFGAWNNLKANRILWWNTSSGIPSDFIRSTLSVNSDPYYYIKGVVKNNFTTPPVLNQTYERDSVAYAIEKKYKNHTNWAAAITERLKLWGFNATGMYSSRYISEQSKLSERLPVEPTWQLSGNAINDYKIKSIYDGAVCPPGNTKLRWQGMQADIFDPQYETVLLNESKNKTFDSFSYIFIPEEADDLFGLNSINHDHLAYIVISQNPYKTINYEKTVTYPSYKLYSKYALRDFLRNLYKDQQENLSIFNIDSAVPFYSYSQVPTGFELTALNNLNSAWNTNYTTWGTSSGSLDNGTNAWGAGTGFMDENGSGILYLNTSKISYNDEFTDPDFPAVRTDLDDFAAFFASKYGSILFKALNRLEHPALFLPLYNGPYFIYQALSPYVDGYWISPQEDTDVEKIYNLSKKPLIIADYIHATPDSPSSYSGTISSLSYDNKTGRTSITVSDARYIFRSPQYLSFPDVPVYEFEGGLCGYNYPYPKVVRVNWDTLEINGDYSNCVNVGMKVELAKSSGPFKLKTQEDRANAIIDQYDTFLNIKGENDTHFVIGFEHWSLYDNEVTDWGEVTAYGLITTHDNAYDGIEAVRSSGIDSRGYITGGEEENYGNLLGTLSEYLKNIENKIEWKINAVDFSANKNVIIESDIIDFYDSSKGNIDKWRWYFGDGYISDLKNPSHKYVSNGIYSVSLVVDGPGGYDSSNKTNFVEVLKPLSFLPYSTTLIVDSVIQFRATGGMPPYSWSVDNKYAAIITNKGVLIPNVDIVAKTDRYCFVTVTDKYGFTITSKRITIPGDFDNDKLPDIWEVKNSLSPQNSSGVNGWDGDYDNDGIINGLEWEYGFYPNEYTELQVPSQPSYNSVLPKNNEDEALSYIPQLLINNSVYDTTNYYIKDFIRYAFEIYTDQNMAQLYDSEYDIPEGKNTTIWQINKSLEENKTYWWRAWSYVGNINSNPMVPASLFVNKNNEEPAKPIPVFPLNESEIQNNENVILKINSSTDPDNDKIKYIFDVFSGDDFYYSRTVENKNNEIIIECPIPVLNDNKGYYWKARAVDEHEMNGQWMEIAYFFVNTANNSPSVPEIAYPFNKSVIFNHTPFLIINNARDIDNDKISYFFEIDTTKTFNSNNIQYSGEIEEDIKTTKWTPKQLTDNTTWYWRVRSFDGYAYSTTWMNSEFFLNTINDAPSIPRILSPKETFVNPLNAELKLQPSYDLDSDKITYEYKIYNEQKKLLSHVTEAGPVHKLDLDFEAGDIYFWHAQAKDEYALESGWTDTTWFKIFKSNNIPSAPKLIEPINNSTIRTLTPELIIQNSVDYEEDNLTYHFQIFNNVYLIGSPIIDIEGINENLSDKTSLLIDTNLSNNKTYWWRVQAYDGKNQGPWSPTFSFTVKYYEDQQNYIISDNDNKGACFISKEFCNNNIINKIILFRDEIFLKSTSGIKISELYYRLQ